MNMEQLRITQKKYAFLLCLFFFSLNFAFAQKSDFKKADLLYRAKSYADAIPIFKKGLSKGKNISARSKLAYCYKMLNQTDKAEEQYAKIVTEKRVRPDVFFYYGEVLMSKAKYDEAKIWFLKYHELEPEELKGQHMAMACDHVPFIVPLFPQANVEAFPHNTDLDDTSPVFYKNGIVFSSDRKSGVKLMKLKSSATGRDYIRLYSSERNEQGEWSSPKSFSGKLNETNKNNANPSFTPDGKHVFFTRNGNVSNRKNAFTLQIYGANREKGKWKNIDVTSFCRPGHNYMHPAVSPDGKTVFFVSDKPGGNGGTDLYYSQRKGDKWSKAINLDTIVNTSAHEGFPFMSEDGKLYFCSKGHFGYGGFDVFVTEKDDNGNWIKPVNVGQPINSPHDDISVFINKENTAGTFTSSREGGDDDIYLFSLDDEIPVSSEPPPATANTETNTSTESSGITTTEVPVVVNETDIATEITEEITTISNHSTENAPSENPISNNEKTDLSIPDNTTQTPIETTEVSTSAEVLNMDDLSEKTESITEPTDLMIPDKSISTEATLEPEIKAPDTTIDTNLSVSESPISKETESTQITPKTSQEIETLPTSTESINVDSTTHNSGQKVVSAQDLNVNELEETTPVIEQESNTIPSEAVGFSSTHEGSSSQGNMLDDNITEQLLSTKAFQKAVSKGKQKKGMHYVLKNLNYYPGEYLLAPKMTLQLSPIVKMMEQQPELIIEIAAHTGSIGYDNNNLTLSKKRAKAIKNYLLYKGIDSARVVDIGFGETKLLNHCGNGVVCTEEEHLANERVEIWVR